MRRLIAVLVVLAFVSLVGEAREKVKIKSKSFEPVTVLARDVAGSYGGPAESYGLVLEVAPGGSLRGNYVEMGRVAVLNAIVLNGADFSARASFDDGSSRTINGSFAIRVLNGARAFGLRMHDVPVEGFGEIDTFFERFAK